MVNGDKARADEIMETGLDAGRDDGRDPDRDRDIVGEQFWLFCYDRQMVIMQIEFSDWTYLGTLYLAVLSILIFSEAQLF